MKDHDTQILARVRLGDTEALAQFVQSNREPLLGFIRKRIGSQLQKKVEPEDVLQEASLEAVAALSKMEKGAWDLHAGPTLRVASVELTVKEMCNKFMTAKQRQHDADDLTRKRFVDYLNSCQNLIKSFGGDRLVTDLAADAFSRLRASLSERLITNSLSTAVQ